MIWHVYPVNDVREHCTQGGQCPCEPRADMMDNGDIMYVHNSWLRSQDEQKSVCAYHAQGYDWRLWMN